MAQLSLKKKLTEKNPVAWASATANISFHLPDTRDYKRAFDDDKGPNTGGMGSYKDVADYLPFLTAAEREQELALADGFLADGEQKSTTTPH